MADLDYAFLADFARVDQAGTLTAVGASFTHVSVQAVPTNQLMSVAGRIRSRLDADPVQLSVRLVSPQAQYSMSFGSELSPGPNVRPYRDGQVGLLFAATLTVPIVAEGVYEVTVELDQEVARVLRFEVNKTSP